MTIVRGSTPSVSQETAYSAITKLREIALAAAAPAALRAAIQVGIAEKIGDAPVPLEQLAGALSVNAEVLGRLLLNLEHYGIFARTADGYAHTATSRLLREDDPSSLKFWVLWVTEPWAWELWPHLADAVRKTGHRLFEDKYGTDFFTYLHKEWRDSTEIFNRSQTELSRLTSAALAEALDLGGVQTIADIGGGRGYTLSTLLEKNPHLHGTLVDLPAAVANPDPRLRPGGSLAPRSQVKESDCLKAIPVEADVYLFKSILEWDDERTVKALRNAVAAARPDSRILIATNLVDDSPEIRYATGIDLLFLLNTNGKRHTKSGITTLIEKAGLRVDSVSPVKPLLHVIEASIPDLSTGPPSRHRT